MKLKKNWINLFLVIILITLIGFDIGYFVYSRHFGKISGTNSYFYFSKDNPQIEEIIEANKKIDLTNHIYEICNEKELPQDKLYCLNDYVESHYKYRDVGDEIYTIDEMFQDGADCKSYSFYYATLADMMGYDYTFILIEDGHVATIVPFENGYCLLDQSVADCIGY